MGNALTKFSCTYRDLLFIRILAASISKYTIQGGYYSVQNIDFTLSKVLYGCTMGIWKKQNSKQWYRCIELIQFAVLRDCSSEILGFLELRVVQSAVVNSCVVVPRISFTLFYCFREKGIFSYQLWSGYRSYTLISFKKTPKDPTNYLVLRKSRVWPAWAASSWAVEQRSYMKWNVVIIDILWEIAED